MDTTPLRDAFQRLLGTAAIVTEHADASPEPPAGEWNGDQILAHVTLVNATTISAVSAVTSGLNATYDNRIAQDTWTIDRAITLAGGSAGLRDRIGAQGEALCALVGPALSETELDMPVPTRLLSNDAVLVDQAMPLRDLLIGLAETELPGHTEQLRALLPDGVIAPAT